VLDYRPRQKIIIMADQISQHLQTESPKQCAGRERRAWVRLASERDASCRPIAGFAEAAWLGTVRDISQGGVALILRRRFEPGTGLFIEVETNAGESRCLPARVVRVKLESAGSWITGCAFASLLSPEELQTLVRQ
jgi:hypothetical protein